MTEIRHFLPLGVVTATIHLSPFPDASGQIALGRCAQKSGLPAIGGFPFDPKSRVFSAHTASGHSPSTWR